MVFVKALKAQIMEHVTNSTCICCDYKNESHSRNLYCIPEGYIYKYGCVSYTRELFLVNIEKHLEVCQNDRLEDKIAGVPYVD